MLLQADFDNTVERSRNPHDPGRLGRYKARRKALLEHRRGLEALYVAVFGENPWEEIAF